MGSSINELDDIDFVRLCYKDTHLIVKEYIYISDRMLDIELCRIYQPSTGLVNLVL